MNEAKEPRRRIPSVEKVLQSLDKKPGSDRFSHEQKVFAVRSVLDKIRSKIDKEHVPALEEIVETALGNLDGESRSGIRRVVNATGIILHTALGRAALPREAMEATAKMDGYCSLQMDLEQGSRGRRETVIEALLQRLTGAEAATIVNNNAAATLLVLAALCAGKEVIVSRGQLIEIGGSFRLPDVIAQSGARMVEVGTTNKTHLRDYTNAIGENTTVLLHVNPSNYRIVGFAEEVSVADLAGPARERGLILVDDLGCGALIDLSQFGLPHETTVQESIASGADVALFSGDKLIGGPQAGIIVGRKEYIERIRKHPLARALRVGKMTIAAMEATLRLFLNPDTLIERNPTLRMLATPYNILEKRAKDLSELLSKYVKCTVIEGESACGGGSLPTSTLRTSVVAVTHPSMSASELAERLRLGEPPVITRVHDGTVLLDVRTLLPGDENLLENAVQLVYTQ